MSLKLTQFPEVGSENTLTSYKHMLFVLTENEAADIPYGETLRIKLKRTHSEYKDLYKTPLTTDLPNGGIASFVVLEEKLNTFQCHTLLRKAIAPLLDEQPSELAIFVFGNEATRESNACAAYYVATVNAAKLPNRKKEDKFKALENMDIRKVLCIV